jgi:CubicO group peptidase (beta-lactamase class C family)
MTKNFLLTSILLFCYSAIAQNSNVLHEQVLQLSKQSGLSGFTVSILNADSVLFSRGYGYANKEQNITYQTDHVQIVASVSKTWIGLALMQCVEQGKISLDTKVNDVLPFEVTNPNYPNQPITVRQLATHTSSIIYSIPAYEKIVFEERPDMELFEGREKKVVKKILKNPKLEMGDYLKDHLSANGKNYNAKNFGNYPPGEKYKYSNIASTLAAYLVEEVSGMSFADFCQKNISKPLGLKNAAFNVSNPDKSKIASQYFGKKQKLTPLYSHNFYPTGGLRISNDDLNLFLMEIIKGYEGRGKLLTANNYTIFSGPQFHENELPESFPKNETNHGIFWTYRDELIGHTGGGLGTSAFMFFDKNTGIEKIFVTNCELEADKNLVPQFIQVWQTLSEYENKF